MPACGARPEGPHQEARSVMIPSSCPDTSPDSAGLPIRPTAIAGYPIAGPRGGMPDPGGEPGQEAGNRHGRSSWGEPLRAGPARGAAGSAHRTADRHHQQPRALKVSLKLKVWLPLECLYGAVPGAILECLWGPGNLPKDTFVGQATSRRIPLEAGRSPKGCFAMSTPR